MKKKNILKHQNLIGETLFVNSNPAKVESIEVKKIDNNVVRSKNQQENDALILEQNKEKIDKYTKGIFNYEDFEDKIKDQIVFCINNYKDLP